MNVNCVWTYNSKRKNQDSFGYQIWFWTTIQFGYKPKEVINSSLIKKMWHTATILAQKSRLCPNKKKPSIQMSKFHSSKLRFWSATDNLWIKSKPILMCRLFGDTMGMAITALMSQPLAT